MHCCTNPRSTGSASSRRARGRRRRPDASRCAAADPYRPLGTLLRASSRLIVEGLRRTYSAIARLLSPVRCRSAIVTRSSWERYRELMVVLRGLSTGG